MEKVKESFEKSETKCRDGRTVGGGGGGSKPAKPSSAPAESHPQTQVGVKPKPKLPAALAARLQPKSQPPPSTSEFDDVPPSSPKPPVVRAPPARLATKKPPPPSSTTSSAPPSTATKKPPTTKSAPPPPSSSSAGKPSEPLRYKFTQESAESQVESNEAIPSNLISMLADSNWKVRLEGIEKLGEWVKTEGRSTDSEIIVRWLVGKKPGGKESNFQVSPLLASFPFVKSERMKLILRK